MIIKKANDNFYWFQCPGCGDKGHIDKEQAEGKISILCENCGYHETKNWLKDNNLLKE